jgi:hypothetical protein
MQILVGKPKGKKSVEKKLSVDGMEMIRGFGLHSSGSG